jgi:hypothetical protein
MEDTAARAEVEGWNLPKCAHISQVTTSEILIGESQPERRKRIQSYFKKKRSARFLYW